MGQTQLETDIQHSVDFVKQFFKKGTLRNKQAEAETLLKNGHTFYFNGEIEWSIELPEYDRLVKGQSETLESGIYDIKAALSLLGDDYGHNETVMLFLNSLEEEKNV